MSDICLFYFDGVQNQGSRERGTGTGRALPLTTDDRTRFQGKQSLEGMSSLIGNAVDERIFK